MELEKNVTGLPVFTGCLSGGGGGDKCNLHFIVENEIMATKSRLDKFEEKSTQGQSDLQKSFSDLATEVKTFMHSQSYRDRESDRMGDQQRTNMNDISDLKSSNKLLIDSNINLAKSVGDINDTLKNLNNTIINMDKSIVNENDIGKIVRSAIIEDDHVRKTKWFDSVPAKISTTIAVLTFAAYWIGKLIVMLITTI